jgi:hypothetical protein
MRQSAKSSMMSSPTHLLAPFSVLHCTMDVNNVMEKIVICAWCSEDKCLIEASVRPYMLVPYPVA